MLYRRKVCAGKKGGWGGDLQEEKVFDSLKTPQPVVKDKIRG